MLPATLKSMQNQQKMSKYDVRCNLHILFSTHVSSKSLKKVKSKQIQHVEQIIVYHSQCLPQYIKVVVPKMNYKMLIKAIL